MLVEAKILIGEHWHKGKKYIAGEIVPVPEILVKDMPRKFEVIKNKPELDIVKEVVEPLPEPIEKDEMSSLIIEGEELNQDGFPVVFIPKKQYDNFNALPDDTVFPFKYSPTAQWFFLSNGCKVMGATEAERGEKLIKLIYGK